MSTKSSLPQTVDSATHSSIVDSDWPAAPYIANWYVVMAGDTRFNLLLGPYLTHEQAAENFDRAYEFAIDKTPLNVFATFGIANVDPAIELEGSFNKFIGLIERGAQ